MSRTMIRVLSGTLTALVLTAVTGTASSAAYAPAGGGTFNVPRPWGSTAENWRIVRHVDRAIANTPQPSAENPAPTILISTYLLDSTPSVDALISACRRGVSVRVILDGDIDNWNSKRLIRVLNADNVPDTDRDGQPDSPASSGPCDSEAPGTTTTSDSFTDAEAQASASEPTEHSVTWGADRSYVKKCDGSCRGAGGNMHSKFYAFSRTGVVSDVVMVSSSNLNRGGARNGWNDLYTMVGRPESYEVYRRIHREMTDDTTAGDGKVEAIDGPFTSRFFPMRDATRANDPTLADLNKIGCSSVWGRTKVNVSMFYWEGTRGNYLADKLLSLARQGCQVSLIYGAPSVQIATRLRDAARRNLISLYDSRWDFNGDGYNEVRTHAKYVLVKGQFGGDSSSWQVMTGSPNWVEGSLSRGDETTLNIALQSAYDQYLADWNEIRRHSRALPYRR